MEKNKEPLLEEIVARLARQFNPEMIYLFGSRAQGGTTPSSDYDILVVVKSLQEPAYKYSQTAHEVLWGLKCSKDIFFTSLEQFEALKASVGSLSELVHRNGKKLYAAVA